MFENMTPDKSAALDIILRARRSVRAFNPVPPEREAIEAIIQAGLRAPFGALAVAGKPDFRKVFVIRNASPAMEVAAAALKSRMIALAVELERSAGPVPFVRNLKRIGQQGVSGVGSAPYYVVVGERKGVPPIAARSLSYCLQNMWLKATSLGIGFQLVSATTEMENEPDICGLLGIPCGEYALDGCALGYPAEDFQPPPVEYPTLARSVRWL